MGNRIWQCSRSLNICICPLPCMRIDFCSTQALQHHQKYKLWGATLAFNFII